MKNRITLIGSLIVAFIFSVVLFVACKKENNTLESSENLLETRLKLKPLANTDKTKAISSIINNVKQTGMYYSSVSDKLDIASARVFLNELERKYVVTFHFQNDTTKSYSVYGNIIQNEYKNEGEVLIANETNADGSYTKYVVKNKEAFKATGLKDAKPVYEDLDAIPNDKWQIILTTDCSGRHGGTGFCQREPGESFGACHRAEVDEFTDDFLGWLYYKANELVVDALIAAACSCSATQCPKK